MADVVSNMNEMHKKVYSKRPMPKVIPEIAKLQKLIPFSEKEKLGDKYVVGVRLAYPNGFTHAKGDGTAGAFALNDVKGGTQKKAEMDAYQILLRDHMSYEDAGKAVRGERSFVNGTEFFYEGLQLSARKRLETCLLYGQSGIGKVGVYTAANAAYGNDATIQIPLADWGPQIFAGIEGAELDVMTAATAVVRGTITLKGVDIETRTLILEAPLAGTAANDVLYFKGAYGKEIQGLFSIMSNTGNLFGINAAQYSLWKGNSVNVAGQFSFAKLKKGLSLAVAKGLFGRIDLFLNPGAWDDLQTSIEATRQTSDKDVKKVDIGMEEIVYHSQSGTTHIHSHPMIKEAHGFGLFTPTWKRVGAVDLSLGAPGFNGAPWFNLPNNAGVEARIYTNQGIMTETPAQNILFTGIVNSV